MTLKFLLTVLWKTKSNCMSGLFCIANLLELGRKKNFFSFMDFNLLKTKIK